MPPVCLFRLGLLAVAAMWSGGCAVTGRYMCTGQPLFHEAPTLLPTSAGPVSVTIWRPTGEVRGVIVAAPGLDESAREWHYLGTYLAHRGYAVYALDLRGQGLDYRFHSRGNYGDWRRWVQDFGELATQAQRRHPAAPVYYAGLSAGALVAMDAAVTWPDAVRLRGMILQSPAVAMLHPPPLVRPGLALTELLTLNGFRVTTPAALRVGPSPVITNDSEETAWERSPDRVCRGFTAHSLQAYFSLGAHTERRLGRLQAPMLLQFGGQDPVMIARDGDRQKGAEAFTAELGARDKTVRRYPQGSHDLLNDSTTRDALLRDVVTWLRKH